KQVLCLAAELSMVRFGTIAIDGTKLRANASKHKAMSYERMLAREQELQHEIEAIIKRAAGEDQTEDVAFGPDFRGEELPQELPRREARLETIQAAKERLERRQAELAAEAERERQEQLAAKGKDPSGKRRGRKHQSDPARPKAKDQENFTDPDSRIMKSQDGYQQ
ncbi:MAG: IS5/IS1182 family transposase, partial [Planctomycetota bacterium]